MKRNHRNPWYPHLGRRSLHLLYCPLCLSTYNMGRPVALQAPIIQPAQQFPCRARQVYDTALCKDAVAMGLTNWSKLNTDLYNFQILTPSLPPANARESPSVQEHLIPVWFGPWPKFCSMLLFLVHRWGHCPWPLVTAPLAIPVKSVAGITARQPAHTSLPNPLGI